MERSLPEVVQHPVIDDTQINERGIPEVEVGTRKLGKVFLDPRRLGFGWPEGYLRLQSGNGGKMDMRVDQAWNKKLSLSRNHRRAGRSLRSLFSVNANDTSVLDQDAAFFNVIELLRRNEEHVRN